MIIAYQYSYGDGTLYWDCYYNQSFVGRCHSETELKNMAAMRGCECKVVL